MILTTREKKLKKAGWQNVPSKQTLGDKPAHPRGLWQHKKHGNKPHTLDVAWLVQFGPFPDPDGKPFAEFVAIEDQRRIDKAERTAEAERQRQLVISDRAEIMAFKRRERALAK